jgi:hypothetical protein
MSDLTTVLLDRPTTDLIDNWRNRSILKPSRRAATRALVRIAIKAQNAARARAAAPAPTTIVPAAGEQVSS